MIKKSFYILTAVVAMLFASCEKYDHAISDIEDRLDKIEGTSLTTIDQQITAINGSIDDLKGVDVALQSLIDNLEDNAADLQQQLDDNAAADAATKKTLEDEIAAIKALIATLQAKDTELDQKIADLQTYVDNEISTIKDWANATFATLTQYDAVQTEISAIKALIEQNKTDITAAYTDAIKTAITASETSMKEWVNGVLADSYYTKAEIDGKITALQTQVTEGDAALQKEIDELKAALAKAENDLTAAYKKAIEDAITDNNGKISADIAAAVKTAQDNLQAQIDAINSEIEKIKARLDIIEADINSIKQQIEDLKGVDAELKGYIESLQNTANDLQSKIDATNNVLTALESDLEGQITASEQKMLDELNTVKTALEGKLATINNTITTLTSQLTAIEGKIASLETAVAACATQEDVNNVKQELATVKSDMEAIKTAITELQTRMATVEGEVDSLQTTVADLKNRIEALEKNFANRIQSLTFVPQYSDGKILMDYTGRTTQAHFRLSPAAIAKLIAVKNVEAFARYTNDPTTRAYEPEFPLVVESVTGDETGMLEVNLKEDSENLFDTDFWAGKKEAVIYIQITDENGNNVVSDAIPMMAHGYGSNEGNRVYGFGDGNTYTGEITE